MENTVDSQQNKRNQYLRKIPYFFYFDRLDLYRTWINNKV